MGRCVSAGPVLRNASSFSGVLLASASTPGSEGGVTSAIGYGSRVMLDAHQRDGSPIWSASLHNATVTALAGARHALYVGIRADGDSVATFGNSSLAGVANGTAAVVAVDEGAMHSLFMSHG